MTEFVGMTIETVEEQGRVLKQKSAELGNLLNGINAIVQGLAADWKGQDATQFEQQWSGDFRPQLKLLADAIDQLGQKAVANAADQRSASNS